MTSRTAPADSRILLWIGFLLVHLVIGWFALHTGGGLLGDVSTAYEPWALLAVHGGIVVGVDTPWVYPILALPAILAPLALGPSLYVGAWLTMVLLLNAGAFAVLVSIRRAHSAAWWWLGFLVLLGPIAFTRLDAVSVPFAIVALVVAGLHPRLAGALLAVAAWVKVWPGALILAGLVALRSRRRMLSGALLASVVIAAAAVAVGAGDHLLAFVTQQTARGLQIEAPVSTPWLWLAAAGLARSSVYYDTQILTYQVAGDGTAGTAAVMTPVLAVAVALVLLLGIRARPAGAALVLPALALALVTSMIAFNKVGSPQYIAWLAAPVILGILRQGTRFRAPAVLTAVLAALTQTIYPYWYDQVLTLNPVFLTVLTARNALLFVLLGWCAVALWRAPRAAGQSPWSRMPSTMARLRNATLVPRS